MLGEHFPVIRVTGNLAVLVEVSLRAAFIDVAHGNELSATGNCIIEVTTALAPTANLGEAKRFSLMVVPINEFGRTKRSRSSGSGPKKATAIGLSRVGWFGHERTRAAGREVFKSKNTQVWS